MKFKENMNPNIFREYDIRGVYPTDIDEDFAYTIGLSYGSFLREKYNTNKCVVGYDNRISSRELNHALVKGLLASGADIINIGLCTTPTLYYARYIYNRPGIMITASHNPKEDNGFKFSFDPCKNAAGEKIKEFKDYTFEGKFLSGEGTFRAIDLTDEYIDFLHKDINMGDRKLKVVITPGNGTAALIDEKVFDVYNFDMKYIFSNSDGTFPHHHPDPNVEENLEALKQTVLENNADIGIGFDGDEDRIGVIAEDGTFIGPDYLMIIIIRDIINKVEDKKFLFDVKCSKSLSDEIIKLGGTPVIYRTGASYTGGKVVSDDIPFGGEYSGHLYFNDGKFPIGSGFVAALRLLEILSKTDKSITELLEGVTEYKSTPEIKIATDDDKKFDIVNKVKEYCLDKNYEVIDIDGVRAEFSDGWALVRASNTGPNITARFQAKTEKRLNEIHDEFMSLLENKKS